MLGATYWAAAAHRNYARCVLDSCRYTEPGTMKVAALLCLLACAGYAAACAHTYTHSRGLMAVRSCLPAPWTA